MPVWILPWRLFLSRVFFLFSVYFCDVVIKENAIAPVVVVVHVHIRSAIVIINILLRQQIQLYLIGFERLSGVSELERRIRGRSNRFSRFFIGQTFRWLSGRSVCPLLY